MQVGDKYPFTEKEFRELAPRGLVVRSPFEVEFYYKDGKYYGKTISGVRPSVMNGWWMDFNEKNIFEVISLPILKLATKKAL